MRVERPVPFLVGGAGTAITAAAIVLMLATGGARGARATSSKLATFTTPGTYSWTVPTGISSVTLDVFGASGGNAVKGNVLVSLGGAGGQARGRFAVKPGQRFEIVVGGPGGDPQSGGFNGGGRGSEGGRGGGGSDVRIGGIGNPCVSNKSCGYSDRIVVGGGGGGGGDQSGDGGGTGGGISGTAGASGAGAGGGQESTTSTACGNEIYSGCFGQGGGVFQGEVDASGGGGGGWYGGTAGYGGGGGSGFVSRFALSGSFPGGTNIGAGRVVISSP